MEGLNWFVSASTVLIVLAPIAIGLAILIDHMSKEE
jgi:hypothetical protein